jgi:hypothetical protein
MQANIGDRIVVASQRAGGRERSCQVLETRGHDGSGPFLVRWLDTGHESLFFPGLDASVTALAHTGSGRRGSAPNG